MECATTRERRKALPRFDERLAKAASKDMAAYLGETMSSIAFRSKAPGANGIRTKQVFSRFGWCEVRHPYRVGSPEESDVFKAFGVERKMTPSASKAATMFAVTQGSFREAKDTLALLGCGDISTSKLRKETLRVGEAALAGLRAPEKDVRQYSDVKLRTPEGARRVRNVQVYDGGTGGFAPLDPAKIYRVAGNSFTLVEGGDGFDMFKRSRALNKTVETDYLALAEYAKAFAKGRNGVPRIKSANSPLAKLAGYPLAYERPEGSGRIAILK